MIRTRRLVPFVAVVVACQPSPPADSGASESGEASSGGVSGSGSSSGGPASTSEGGESGYTYYRDAKAILDTRCATCHRPNDIAPFSLETGEEAVMFASLIAGSITDGTMPPWPPSAACNSYDHARSLTPGEREVLLGWIDGGAVLGDPADVPPGAMPPAPIAWDLELALPEPYTPTLLPDDYRCLIVEWPEKTLKYVTGFDVVPDKRPIVHHAIAFLIPPTSVLSYKKRDAEEAGPGYTCFGSPGGDYGIEWLGAWAPGTVPEVDETRGIPVKPGSALVVQMHYHPTDEPMADQTKLRVKLADSVQTPMHVVPFTNPDWLGGAMRIPAGDAHAVHAYTTDYSNFLGSYFPSVGIKSGDPFVIHRVGLHMHTRGTQASLSVERSGGESECALHIPRWDFNWQGSYSLQQRITVNPGDQLQLGCEWDNSAANQPIVDGKPMDPVDLYWGEGTGDEMCLAIMAVSRAP